MSSRVSFRLLSSVSVLVIGTGGVFAQQAATPLERIVVEGAGTVSDTSDRMFLKQSTSATKTGTAALETPQATSSVTRRQIDEQNPQTVSEALRYTSGVLSDRDSNARYDSVFLRGFGAFGTATNYVSFLDGLKLPRGQAFAQTSIDPFLLDRIEVLKGPSALLYGQTSPGGLVNQISRAPSAEPYNEVWFQGGTHSRMQGGLSSRGALSSDGTWQYGISAVGRVAGTRYDDVDEKRFGVAPSLTWQPDADTSLTISGYFQKDPEGGYFNSLYPTFLAPEGYRSHLGRDLNIGDPGFDAFEREQYGIGYQFEHRFNDLVTVRSNLRYSHVAIDFRSLQMSGPINAAGEIPRHALRSIEDAGGLSFDNQAEFNFSTGALEHVVLAGIDYQSTGSDWQYRFGAAPALNVTNPQYGQPIGPLMTFIDSHQKLRQTGIYVQDQMSFGGFRAVVGVRHDWTRQVSENRLATTSSEQSSGETSYRAGLLYQFENGLAPYASYSTSFEPTIGVDASGNPFEPTSAQQYEIGLKYQPAGFDALFTVSAFDIRQTNVLTPGSIPGFNVQEGEIHSRGIEFEARGNLTSNLELIAALTLLDTRVSESGVHANIGKRPQAVPDYFGSIWANYAFGNGTLDGLSVGGGLRFVGSSYADDANTIKADGYALVDLALRYDFGAKNHALKGLEGTFNVTNLFDKEYYSSCSSNIYCQFGNGRQVQAGLRYKW
ncbi:hydroxamate-type ferrisiderophore receptor [Nitratireductor aquibiodomus RA22]|uniref:Hydroxamate-type ferrisiderophore receptor n=1 Tax=Nitratireductor aquibiodomus RA22 TaxID=1189611 RepID=I5C3X1_9HYPH|nr:TonB-dependent siderophore receptor [Nitratireductor aquibiodomus]EIM76523.1 hydroxamate-type ferrisiderophore receptor [Nitratireductor aquibiodomus RA22]